MSEHKIKVFSTLTCPYCIMLKKYFDEKKVAYENIDVTHDPKAADEMIKRSGKIGVPQVWIDEKTVVGFDQEQIDEILGL